VTDFARYREPEQARLPDPSGNCESGFSGQAGKQGGTAERSFVPDWAKDFLVLGVRSAVTVLLEHPQESFYHPGIEVLVAQLQQFLGSLLVTAGFAVDTVAGHGVVGVDHG